MTIEKFCEYFNEIGILQLESINKFLKIYSQLSQNKYKNKSDKIILALFSYMTLISKNEQQLYDICKNIIYNYSNNLLVYRYRALSSFNNIFKSKVHFRFLLFFSKLNSFIFNKNNYNKYIGSYNRQNSQREEINVNYMNNSGRLNGKFIKKNIRKIYEKNNYKNDFNISDDDKECTFSPRIIRYFKNNNNKPDFYSSYKKNIFNKDISFNNKYIPFKNSINYGYNDKINNEIEKMLSNMSKYSINPNNEKYLPKKTIYRKKINNINPSNSYNDFSNNDISCNNPTYLYYDEDYDFYQNEKEHVKKVQDKILQLKLQKLEQMSKEYTFSPEINKNPKFINNINEPNIYLTEYIENNRNYLSNKKTNKFLSNTLNYKNESKNKKMNEYQDNYYNEYPEKLDNNRKKKRSRTYSDSKKDREYSIYKARKEELSKLLKEKYPFAPNIKNNKKFKVKSTFNERQEKFLKNKEKLKKQKEEEELKLIEELNKKYNQTKTDSKKVINRLYNKEAEKIKKRLKKEMEEKLKKKNIINWEKRRKKHTNPEDYKKKIFNKKIKLNINKEHQKEEIGEENSNIFNNEIKDEKDGINFGLYSKNINSKKQENSNQNIKNKKLLIDRIKDDHVIGFKQNFNDKATLVDNQNSEEEKYFIQKDKNNNEEYPDNNYKAGISLNFEEKLKDYEQNKLLYNIMNKDGIKSTAFQEMMNKQ